MTVQAQLTLPDGKTPGAWRRGSSIILACIAQGCRIYPNPLNKIPDEWSRYLVDADSDGGDPVPVVVPPANNAPRVVPELSKRKRGRPKKNA